jgi:serine/threonine protein kinase
VLIVRGAGSSKQYISVTPIVRSDALRSRAVKLSIAPQLGTFTWSAALLHYAHHTKGLHAANEPCGRLLKRVHLSSMLRPPANDDYSKLETARLATINLAMINFDEGRLERGQRAGGDLDDITLDSTLSDTELSREDLATVNLDTIALDDEFPVTLPLHAAASYSRGQSSEVANAILQLRANVAAALSRDTPHTGDARLDGTLDAANDAAAPPAVTANTPPDLGSEQHVTVTAQPAAAITFVTAPLPAPSQAANMDATPSLLRDRYQLEQAIASGGNAIIYRAHDLRRAASHSSATIAVKILKPAFRDDERAIERLKREYEYTLKLIHPNIVRVFDLDCCDHHGWFMTMELVEGDSLTTVMRRAGANRLPLSQSLSLITACAQVLRFAHEHGVFHCDFKPGNIIVRPSGQPCLLDFGAAYLPTNNGGNRQRAAATTPAYASPQLLAGENVDARDDLFSLACTAYELLDGHHPFGYLSAVAVPDYEQSLLRPAQLSEGQWHAVRRALSRAREQRHVSVAAFFKEFTAKPRRDLHWVGAGAMAIIVSGLALMVSNALLTQPKSTVSFAHSSARSSAISSMGAVTQAQPRAATAPQVVIAAEDSVINSSTTNTAPDATHPAATLPVTPSPTSQASKNPLHEARPVSGRKAAAMPLAARNVLAFEPSALVVSERAVAAALTVTRSDTRDNLRIQWRVIDGSAHAGVDYEPLTSATAVFAKNQARRTIYINLKNNLAAHGDRSLVVEVRSAGAQNWERAEVIVRHAQ